MAKDVPRLRRVDEDVLKAMESMNGSRRRTTRLISPASAFRERVPRTPLVGLFETAFTSGRPRGGKALCRAGSSGCDWGVRRWGFHGASHQYIAERAAELLGRETWPSARAGFVIVGGPPRADPTCA